MKSIINYVLYTVKASNVSTKEFLTLHSKLPHYLIKQKSGDLFSKIFKRLDNNYIACSMTKAFSTTTYKKQCTLFTCDELIESL